MGGRSGKAVASHTPFVVFDGNHLAVSQAQYRLIARAINRGGALKVKGGEVRTARALSLFGELRDDGALSADGCGNPDGERWTFTLKDGRVKLP
jgi:hypothetical protein